MNDVAREKLEVLKRQIIDYIRRNRVSTTEVADALGKKGVIPGVKAVNSGFHCVGEVFFAYAHDETNWYLHKQLESVPEGCIVFVKEYGCNERALFGDLVSKYLLLYRQAEAVVVDGNLRDAHRFKAANYKLWVRGFSPVGCFNKKVDRAVHPEGEKDRERYHGGIMVCDDTGVVFISKEDITPKLLRRLEFIEKQEDMWYYCVDTLKLSTYETVCLKRYLYDDKILDLTGLARELEKLKEKIND